jgi:hypothetical protein
MCLALRAAGLALGVLAAAPRRPLRAQSAGVVPLPASAPEVARAERLSPAQTEALVLLGRVWGFVKYHHPRVTAGVVDWDAALRRAVPAVLAARTAAAARDTVDAWLAALGDPAPCAPCAAPVADAQLRADVDWIRDAARLGPALSGRLARVYANRSTAPAQHYVRLARGVGNPEFTNEDPYDADPLPPADLRVLGVFRFWNVLEYWFPYRDLMEPDRVAILREFAPAAWAAADAGAYRRTMRRLVARARDTHANLQGGPRDLPPGGTSVLPATLRRVEGRFVVDGYASDAEGAASGLRRGDVLVRIDGAPVDSLTRAWAPDYGASNEAARHLALARALRRGRAGPASVEVERDGRRLTVATRRWPAAVLDPRAGSTHDRPGPAFQMLSDGRDSVAYLKLSGVAEGDAAEYVRRAAAAGAWVIDIRNYPRQFVVFALGSHLVGGPTPFARFTAGRTANPGAFAWTQPILLPARPPRFAGRVVILVDETSISQSEYTAMAFRAAPGALVVGSTTAGADGNVSPVPLPGGLRAAISGIGVFYPDRRPTQQVGIVPDVEVRPTIAGLRAGRDEVLEAAVGRALGRPFRLAP